MVDFRHMFGAVYILENTEARRVKVGMTVTDVSLRLRDINFMWLSMKATCQVCTSRRLVGEDGRMPKHVISGIACPGGDELPLEKDMRIAESRLKRLKHNYHELSGNEKGSATAFIKNLEKRIEFYRDFQQPVGRWRFSTAFYTDCAEKVELLSHEILEEHLDREAPFGEVFCCEVSEATEAVESVLGRLGLSESARKEIRDDSTSEENGKCIICDQNLTKSGSCPDCSQRSMR